MWVRWRWLYRGFKIFKVVGFFKNFLYRKKNIKSNYILFMYILVFEKKIIRLYVCMNDFVYLYLFFIVFCILGILLV